MSLMKIRATVECDKCGKHFEVDVPTDANTDECATVFEVVLNHLDSVMDTVQMIDTAGFHEGQFYCPPCYEPIDEAIFVEEIKQGKHTRENLEGLDPKYLEYLPHAT